MNAPGPSPEGFLEFVTRWAPVTQFFAPLVALVAAGFTLVSAYAALQAASASRTAANASVRANDQAHDERAHKFRPVMDVQLIANARDGEFHGTGIVVNLHPSNVAHRIVVEVKPSPTARYERVVEAAMLGRDQDDRCSFGPRAVVKPLDEVMKVKNVQFVQPILHGRIEYSDELGLARWSQRFKIVEYAQHMTDDGTFPGRAAIVAKHKTYQYTVERWTAPKRMLPSEYEEEDD